MTSKREKKKRPRVVRERVMKLDLPTIPEQITGNWLPESTDAKWRWVFRVMLVLVILGIVAFLIYDIMLFL